jgi:DNA-binding MarR family transcriptional regulator
VTRVPLLTKEALILLHISQNPRARMAQIAKTIGVDVRTVRRKLAKLERAGYVAHIREANHKVYRVSDDALIDAGEIRTVAEFQRAFLH